MILFTEAQEDLWLALTECHEDVYSSILETLLAQREGFNVFDQNWDDMSYAVADGYMLEVSAHHPTINVWLDRETNSWEGWDEAEDEIRARFINAYNACKRINKENI